MLLFERTYIHDCPKKKSGTQFTFQIDGGLFIGAKFQVTNITPLYVEICLGLISFTFSITKHKYGVTYGR